MTSENFKGLKVVLADGSVATIEAIRCSMDGVRTRENQALGSKLSSLSNAIAGGPYIGLLPENVRPLFQGTIRYHHDVAHGPLPGLLSGHFSPGRARVETTFDMSEGTRKTLQRH